MKSLTFILLFITSNLVAQFGPKNDLGTNGVSGIVHVFASDLDNDGDPDILSASTADDKIAWYENLGNDQYAVQKIISTEADEAMCVHAADIDGDGDNDVLSASAWDDKVAWYENDGLGNFGPQIVIGLPVSGAYFVVTGDLNGDGDLDIVVASNFDHKVIWFENLGGGTFGSEQVIADDSLGPYSIDVKDLDNDSDLDVLVAYYAGDNVLWYQNDGNGVFGSGNMINSFAVQATSVNSGDLDGDGDAEILACHYDQLSWYENLGNGVFGSEQGFSFEFQKALGVQLADTDGDGDKDILAFFQSQSSSFNQLVVYQNTGNLTFTAPLVVTTTYNSPGNIIATDLTNDGLLEIITGTGTRVNRYLNLGQNNFSSHRILNSNVGNEATSIVDVDNDGDMDIVGSGGYVFWLPNFGGGVFGPQEYLGNSGGYGLATGDISGDGNVDVVTGTFEKLFWFNSLGGGNFTSEYFIDSIEAISEIKIADLDGDGDNDIVCSAYNESQVKWFENLGSGISWESHLLGNSPGTSSVTVNDFDNNGTVDIAFAVDGTNSIVWYKNLGNGNFSSSLVIDNSANDPTSVVNGDIDGDGLQDICYTSDKISWKKNLGNGNWGQEQSISSILFDVDKILLVDVEMDGDLDVIDCASNNLNTISISWYPNDGTGHFGLRKIIYFDFYGSSFISAGDLTGDGLPDILSNTGQSNSGLFWFENLWPNTSGIGVCNDTLAFQIVEDSICLGETLSGNLIAIDPDSEYFWNLGNFHLQYGPSISWMSNSTGLFNLSISQVKDECIKDTTIQIYVDPCLSLNEYKVDFFTLFPNPCKTEISIAIPSNSKKGYLIELTDLLGKPILQRSCIGGNLITISLTDHSSGVYLLSVTDQETNSKQTQQLIIE